MAEPQVEAERVVLKSIFVDPPWHALLLPVSGFGIPEKELSAIKVFLRRLTARVVKEQGLSLEVFIQLMQLHWGGGPMRLSEHGREWLPALGLGVWPDREPPKFWTMDDFMNLAEGEKPRTLMYQVLRVTTSLERRDGARDIMLGLGTIVQILTRDSGEDFLKRATLNISAPIKDPSFTCFPFYVPLFEVKTITNASAASIDQWMCGASLYIRESKEDNGILFVSRGPVKELLRSLGATPIDNGESEWEVSV